MARREPKAIPVMVRMEASLHSLLIQEVRNTDDSCSTYLRQLLIQEMDRRGRLTEDIRQKLMGARA